MCNISDQSTALPTVKNPTIDGRPAAENSAELALNGQIPFCLLLGLLPTDLLSFLPLFSSLINSGSMKQLQ